MALSRLISSGVLSEVDEVGGIARGREARLDTRRLDSLVYDASNYSEDGGALVLGQLADPVTRINARGIPLGEGNRPLVGECLPVEQPVELSADLYRACREAEVGEDRPGGFDCLVELRAERANELTSKLVETAAEVPAEPGMNTA